MHVQSEAMYKKYSKIIYQKQLLNLQVFYYFNMRDCLSLLEYKDIG